MFWWVKYRASNPSIGVEVMDKVVVAILAMNYTCLLRIHIYWFIHLMWHWHFHLNILASRSHWVRISNDFKQHCKYVFPNPHPDWLELQWELNSDRDEPTYSKYSTISNYLSIYIYLYLSSKDTSTFVKYMHFCQRLCVEHLESDSEWKWVEATCSPSTA